MNSTSINKSYTPTKDYIKKLKYRDYFEHVTQMKRQIEYIDKISQEFSQQHERKLNESMSQISSDIEQRDITPKKAMYYQKLDLPKFNPGKYSTPSTPQKQIQTTPPILKYYPCGI
ncbi:hypothetical protein TVAG_146450 [Trichomonas vaginalis G3]|uniref:Uncharacterized protein n=1 Tax=Trichomonas vaginalis (strain ATCC PRA-98 / G3) TaxID=412133 RepID=A2DKU9_TRIV3|nr:hypothetical protein TVAGG3_0361320 [Trichomonas vaginalis G3]EAY18902.1 hypothetical protein TVAG_146450 [Trichomonas vaginalis G3]KAI5531957.1 hypothetical protein TVAGG3_0361320 [Trichomonas vaginalis G3]|eukprot:XP_001579888.1 hypothetical protein [Trichomonas vaginalis G3]